MEGISTLLASECILLDWKADSLQKIIKTLTDTLSSVHPTLAPPSLMEKVIDGGVHTTCKGEGCAITHARCPSMDKTLMAVMRLSPAIDLKALDKTDVGLIFLLVGPQSSASFHLKILSRLARLLHQKTLRDHLFSAPTSEAFLQLIIDKEQ
jgi:mannitol/fructose-specific phosphotransferase system IIA component (Ntr-type)